MPVTPESEALFVKTLKELTEKTAQTSYKILIIDACYERDDVSSMALELFAKELDKYLINADYEIIKLNDLNISPCVGCFMQGRALCTYPCVINEPGNLSEDPNDDMINIYEMIKKCDMLFVASSSYLRNLSSQLRRLIERSESIINQQDFFGRKVIKNKVGAGIVISHEHSADESASHLVDWYRRIGINMAPHSIISWDGSTDNKMDDITISFRNDKKVKNNIKKAAKKSSELLIAMKTKIG